MRRSLPGEEIPFPPVYRGEVQVDAGLRVGKHPPRGMIDGVSQRATPPVRSIPPVALLEEVGGPGLGARRRRGTVPRR